MEKIIVSHKKAYYYNNITDFLTDDSKRIVGELVKFSFESNKDQTDAWTNQILSLQEKLKGTTGDIIFEYDITRLGKRIDVVLLIKHMVFSLEFKNGKKIFEAKDAQQAEDYALDIKNFHQESKDLYVCPILVATDAKKVKVDQSIDFYPDKQIYLQKENLTTLISKINKIVEKYGTEEEIDPIKWINSPYHPTPTIINAAIEAYNTHDISGIANSLAGQTIIEKCEKSIQEIITYAQTEKKKCLCFVTGVPGAGKTLVGLDVVSKNLSSKKADSVYLSGNGSLVEVLRAALIKSSKERNKYDKLTEPAVKALIQSSFNFKKDNVYLTEPPAEHILIFDEAQRVWDEKKMSAKHKEKELKLSEPKLLLNIMDKHKDWSVIVCLVGLGQDIYQGEVGINEWFRCGIEEFKNWEMFYSKEIFNQLEDKTINSAAIENCDRCKAKEDLHLCLSIRSFRADAQTKFIGNVLNNNPDVCRNIYKEIFDQYPIFITRDYNKAKEWVLNSVRGSERCGVLACSSAQRLKPEGIYVNKDIDVANWFLAPTNDLRSSNMMEIVASEFKVQGLEIDYAVVCWDADLRRDDKNKKWDYFKFSGSSRKHRNDATQQRYLINSYRVLLTRARQGMVIFVPKGVPESDGYDETRNEKYYNNIYDYLKSCGIKEL